MHASVQESLSIRIREATPKDKEPLFQLLGKSLPFSEDEVICARELIEEGLLQLGAKNRDYVVLVAVDLADRIAGYVCYGPTPLTQAAWDVYWVVTDPLFERRGVATALMRSAETEMAVRQGQVVRIETSSMGSYRAAQRFYEKIGYHLAGAIPDFYKPGDDLLMYWKKIAQTR